MIVLASPGELAITVRANEALLFILKYMYFSHISIRLCICLNSVMTANRLLLNVALHKKIQHIWIFLQVYLKS